MLWREHGGVGHEAIALSGEIWGRFGRKVGASGTGKFLGRRAEGLLHGMGNYKRALGQKDLGNRGFCYSFVSISSCVRRLVVCEGSRDGVCTLGWFRM